MWEESWQNQEVGSISSLFDGDRTRATRCGLRCGPRFDHAAPRLLMRPLNKHPLLMPQTVVFNYVTPYGGLTPAVDLRDRTLLFTHVPKTAGTTLDYILRAAAMTQRIPFLRAMGSIYGQFHGAGKGDPQQDFAGWPGTALA